ncbi:FAD-dependent oxidoreductase [Massilia sp. CCM 9210]|uniref:flavin monoamine oxidase family protein n=1 Tax=Massilia scottii TaxID=3057166 RepID=UPI0027966B12|nr:FAD-dependent oxidoreductase [Massilia sp. CCM 9210]MDQ1812418.1 FAD-dependent oxidoreductase [Massilia sp. CCM 9210]
MTNYSDICIVGAGIGGLSCATQLIHAAAGKNLRIRVFDMDTMVGGRIQSRKIDEEEIAELGAARYSPQLHPHFEQLMRECGLAHATYPFTQVVSLDQAQEKLKATLLSLSAMLKEHPNDSFLEFVSQYLGAAEATRMIKATGYDALLLPVVSAAMAYDIIKKHPETQSFTENAANEWRYATDGYSELLSQLQRQAQDAGVEFRLGHRLLSVEKSGADHVLAFRHMGDTQLHRARHVITTLPPTAMKRLNVDFPAAFSPFQYDSLPLFKGFLTFETAWWDALGLTDKVLMADNPLRKIYFKGDKYLVFYTDSASATYWREYLEQGEDVYLDRVRHHLKEVLPLNGQPLPQIKAHFYKHWPHGVEFSLEPEAEHPATLLHRNGIISCSDAYTAHCGWMEGSLISAGHATRLLLERLSHPAEQSADDFTLSTSLTERA